MLKSLDTKDTKVTKENRINIVPTSPVLSLSKGREAIQYKAGFTSYCAVGQHGG
jgi:hypothetical protein